jgi:hypothetical protein
VPAETVAVTENVAALLLAVWLDGCAVIVIVAGASNSPQSIVTPSMVPPVMLTLLAACVAIVPRPRFVLAVDALTRSLKLLAFASLPPMLFVIVVENEASFPRAWASSAKVFRASGEDATKFDTAVPTNAVVAI